ncbi:MAG: histidine phosphatase family protein [Actinomycetota bacterium]
MAIEIVYETHSPTLDNERGFATGWNQGELSEWGRGQAREAPVDLVHADRGRYIDHPYPGGETYQQVVDRVREFLDELATSQMKRVVVISHRAPWYAMEHVLNGVPLADAVVAPFEWQPGWHYVVA